MTVFGNLTIYGAPRVGQALLAAPCEAGDTSIRVTGVVDWEMSERIVISSTLMDPLEYDEVVTLNF